MLIYFLTVAPFGSIAKFKCQGHIRTGQPFSILFIDVLYRTKRDNFFLVSIQNLNLVGCYKRDDL